MIVLAVPLIAVFFLGSTSSAQDTYFPMLLAQTTTTVTKTVKNPDGTYTIIEYPAKKEVTVDLRPSALLPEATGRANVLRTDEQTLVNVYVAFGGQKTEVLEKNRAKYRGWRISDNEFKTCVDGTVILIESGVVTKTNETCRGTTIAQENPKELNVYAIDDHGAVAKLGPIEIDKNGVGKKTFATPLTRFMLVLSSEAVLTSYEPHTPTLFRSAVPEGFAVIPMSSSQGEKVAAVGYPHVRVPLYSVPLLNIADYKKGDDTKIKVDFSGALTRPRASVFITPRRDGPTEVRVRFHDLNDAPAGKVYILWAASSDNRFVNLGQIVSAAGRNEVEIRAETTLPDFGLLITMEDASVRPIDIPTGPTVATFHVVP